MLLITCEKSFTSGQPFLSISDRINSAAFDLTCGTNPASSCSISLVTRHFWFRTTPTELSPVVSVGVERVDTGYSHSVPRRKHLPQVGCCSSHFTLRLLQLKHPFLLLLLTDLTPCDNLLAIITFISLFSILKSNDMAPLEIVQITL